MERILSVAASESLVSFLQFSLTFGGPEYVQALINCTECPGKYIPHITYSSIVMLEPNNLFFMFRYS